MLYSEYYKKVSKAVAVLSAIKRHWLVIMLSVLAALGIASTFIGTTGLVYDKALGNTEIVYGQELSFEAGAFLRGSDVFYEYKSEGSEEWTREMPIRAGDYSVRAVSHRVGEATAKRMPSRDSRKP